MYMYLPQKLQILWVGGGGRVSVQEKVNFKWVLFN
jgi:hypothetical protein